jgi:hypothetical protein
MRGRGRRERVKKRRGGGEEGKGYGGWKGQRGLKMWNLINLSHSKVMFLKC